MTDPTALYAATVREYGEGYGLTLRDSGLDGTADIEVRGPKVKYTVASDVDDPMAALFVVVPAMAREIERLREARTDTRVALQEALGLLSDTTSMDDIEAEVRRLKAAETARLRTIHGGFFGTVRALKAERDRLTANNEARERLLTRRTDALRAAERRIVELEAEWRRLVAGRACAGCGHWVTMHEDSATVEELGNEVARLRARVAELEPLTDEVEELNEEVRTLRNELSDAHHLADLLAEDSDHD